MKIAHYCFVLEIFGSFETWFEHGSGTQVLAFLKWSICMLIMETIHIIESILFRTIAMVYDSSWSKFLDNWHIVKPGMGERLIRNTNLWNCSRFGVLNLVFWVLKFSLLEWDVGKSPPLAKNLLIPPLSRKKKPRLTLPTAFLLPSNKGSFLPPRINSFHVITQ